MRGGILISAWLAALCVLLLAPVSAQAEARPTAVITYYASDDGPPESDFVEKTTDVMFEDGPPKYAFTVEQYFKTISNGGVDYTGDEGDVYGPYHLATPRANCPFNTWNNEARTLAQGDGFSDSDYAQVIYLYENEPFVASTCTSAGAGGGSFVWVDSLSGYTIVHELGHALGSPHAAAYRCLEGATPVAYSANCAEVEPSSGEASEYGDPFDPMGSGYVGSFPAEMAGWRKLGIGGIAAAEAPTIAYSGTYSLAPLEAPSGTRLLRIPNGTGDFFDLDFRQPIGPFDQGYGSGPAAQGVMIRVDAPKFELSAHPTRLLDMNPATPSFGDAPLAVGRQFRDFRTGVTIETLAVGPAGATVKVSGLPDPPVPAAASSCKVPSLKGKTLASKKGRKEVMKVLTARHCKRGKVKRVRTKKAPKGRVISQRPKPGKTVAAGTKVKIVVSAGPGPARKKGLVPLN